MSAKGGLKSTSGNRELAGGRRLPLATLDHELFNAARAEGIALPGLGEWTLVSPRGY
jgi:hypothetical protein